MYFYVKQIFYILLQLHLTGNITDTYYVQNRTPKRITWMLIIIWFVSLLISVTPIFRWKDAMSTSRVLEEHA
uniref:DUF420 domain-containing protein n=1 Tax=Strongyloides venezuelensis TaxID=75913 RepID=A0A0K0EU13_STRVS